MKKTIITIIATIVLIVPFERAKGQWQTVVTSADFPTVNVLTGVDAKLSFGLWRFEPFIEIGQYLQIFSESMTIETSEFYASRFTNAGLMLGFGTNFRITDNDRIRFGFRNTENYFLSMRTWSSFVLTYLGYVRTQTLSQRTTLDLFFYTTLPMFPNTIRYQNEASESITFRYSAAIAGVD